MSLKSIKGSCHNFCTAVFKDVTYKELKSLLNSRQITLIDVRERWEIVEYGKIPGSVNIPLDEVGEALQMNPKDFKEKYNEVKPSKSDSLVFSCLAGVRSKKAVDTAVSLGFNSMFNIMLEDGRNGRLMNFQKRKKEIEFWNTSWLFPFVHTAQDSRMNKIII
ncbi:3-mercaptopyruvate sulfurtransferase isoform X1 [Prionailurus iriomotensis]